MRTSFGFKREYEDLDAEYHQQPRERVPPCTPKPYMVGTTSPATALEETARARRRVAESVNEPLLREVHLQSHRWWLAHTRTIRERMALSRERFRQQARMLSLANNCVATTETLVAMSRGLKETV